MPGERLRQDMLVPRHFQESPIAFSFRDGILMYTSYVQNVLGPALFQRVRTQCDHLLAGERAIECALVLAKVLPMIGMQPEGISADSNPLITLGQRSAEFVIPTAGNPFQIELIFLEVPVMAVKKLYSSGRQMPVKIGDIVAQRV